MLTSDKVKVCSSKIFIVQAWAEGHKQSNKNNYKAIFLQVQIYLIYLQLQINQGSIL
jgi:hypothetical protein